MKYDKCKKINFSTEYEGSAASHIDGCELLAVIKDLPNQLASGKAKKVSQHYDSVIYLELNTLSSTGAVAVKKFGEQHLFKDWYDFTFSTQAQRSFEAAELLIANNIKTPRAIGWINQWQGRRLKASFYLSEFVEAISVRDALMRIQQELADNSEMMMALLCTIAPAIRSMHDFGFFHGDLGNQNIMLPGKKFQSNAHPMFIDLNRYKLSSSALSLRARSKDLARMLFPSKYRRALFDIYADGSLSVDQLWRVAERKRKLIAVKRQTRPLRHPINTFKGKYKSDRSDAKSIC